VPTGLHLWSRTAASNATADSSVNWAEGQSPSSVNDSARAMMARIAEWRDDVSGALTTGGNSTAYTVSSNRGFASLAAMDGSLICAAVHVTNAANPTLNVDGLGARPIAFTTGEPVSAGVLLANTRYQLCFSNVTGAWVMVGFYGNPYNIPIGGFLDFAGTTAPNSSFALPFGQAISRTTYVTLFALIGTTYGAGDGSTTFNIPDLRGRVVAGKDDMGGTSANRLTNQSSGLDGDVLGAAGGAEAATITQAQLPNCNFTNSGIALNDPGHFHFLVANESAGSGFPSLTGSNQLVQSCGAGGDGSTNLCGTSTAATLGKSESRTTGVTVAAQGSAASGGSGNAHNNVQPTIILNKLMRII
jgi:microcystin-dependent protein